MIIQFTISLAVHYILFELSESHFWTYMKYVENVHGIFRYAFASLLIATDATKTYACLLKFSFFIDAINKAPMRNNGLNFIAQDN